MKRTICVGLVSILTLAALGFGCSSDKGNNSNGSIEAARYPAIKLMLNAALGQLCASIDDALAAQFTTDTAAIPALEWPFEMPARRRQGTFNNIDANTSWGVGYDLLDDTTRYVAYWDLGRLNVSGTAIGHLSPQEAVGVEHEIVYGRLDGEAETGTEWEGELHVSLAHMTSDTAHITATLTCKELIGGECNEDHCEEYELKILDGTITRVGGNLDASTLRGVIEGSLKRTEFGTIVGFDAVFLWDIDGQITSNGTVSLTSRSGPFSKTDPFVLCP